MENREQQILSEIKSMMASIRSQLEILDAKMAELQQVVDPEEIALETVDIDIDLDEVVEAAHLEEVTVQEILMEEDAREELPVVEEEFPEAEKIEEAEVEVETEDTLADDLPESDESAEDDLPVVEESADDDLPESIFAEPESVPVTVAEKAEKKAKLTINDMMADNCAWRKDIPGAPVRDIRSAISLNDRVIFINLLFEEDAQKFVNALTQINGMETFDQAVEYLTSEFPAWDMNSELVYRFMMAVRRRLQ